MDYASKGRDKSKTIKENLERKPSMKRKIGPPPPVRQTLTSYKRMLKANPLMMYQEAGIDIDELFKSRGNSSKMGENVDVVGFKPSFSLEGRQSLREFRKPETIPLVRTGSLKLSENNCLDLGNKKPSIISANKPHTSKFKRPPIKNLGVSSEKAIKPLVKSKVDVTSKYTVGNRVEHKKPLGEIKAKVNSFLKNASRSLSKPSTQVVPLKPEPKEPTKKKIPSLRRSLSSGHIQSKQGKTFDPKQSYVKSNQSHSEEHLNIQPTSNLLGFSPILEESGNSRNLVFKTPSAYERRSICHFTPRSSKKSSNFQASTPAPVELLKLQERLNKWLKSRGKPLASFHHLRCFGIDQMKRTPSPIQINDENKENLDIIKEKSPSYEDLKITKPLELGKISPINNDISEVELAKVAKEAMVELQKLIEEDYPRPQCLGWLELIREKYENAVDEPEYWECRAAIEQSLGNVGNAVEFYRTAIIHGAEVTTVDKSLDQLLKKFSLLNISPSKTEQNKVDGNKERIVREARTVFKSTIIQFAIQERKLKKKDNDEASAVQKSTKQLVATPVRRSTRMSRSAYVTTPSVKLCTSLKEINFADEINFEKNKALC